MHRIKATDLVALRQMIAEREPEVVQRFVDKLSSEARMCFDSAVPVEWLPAEPYCEIQIAAAEVLFPDQLGARTELGRVVAQRSFSTIYKFLLALPTVAFAIRQASVLWSLYHSAGKATIEERRPSSLRLVVRGAPELPPPLVDVISGHLLALAELTRTRNPKVAVASRNPEAWAWLITWEE